MVIPQFALKSSADLLVLTPIVQGSERNVSIVRRLYAKQELSDDCIKFIAGGEHTGIVVEKFNPDNSDFSLKDGDVKLNVTAYVRSAKTGIHRQENRELNFHFIDGVDENAKHQTTQSFFKDLMRNFPNDYLGFVKRVLKLMQLGYAPIDRLDIEMNVMNQEVLDISVPEAIDTYDASAECENVTVAHVQDILENAFPNSITVTEIADCLRCSVEEIENFLLELAEREIAYYNAETKTWTRYEPEAHSSKSGTASPPNTEFQNGGMAASNVKLKKGKTPTVSIITNLFVEKLAVDAMISNKETQHRYKTEDESNVYTIGEIGEHKVVATKLSAIGSTRQALTAAGSITTRLLGNFQDTEHLIVVGCGGGVPHYTDAARHIRLGDVVVSGQGKAYALCESLIVDRKTGEATGFNIKDYVPRDDVLSATAQRMLNDSRMQEVWSELVKDMAPKLNAIIKSSSQEYSFLRPPPESDLLTIDLGDGNVATVPHPTQSSAPRLHVGLVSGGLLTHLHELGLDKNEQSRLKDEFSSSNKVLAFDADFEAVVESAIGNSIPSWVLIRGIADYADGMRNKQWQAYSALQAAAVARVLIEALPKLD